VRELGGEDARQEGAERREVGPAAYSLRIKARSEVIPLAAPRAASAGRWRSWAMF